MKLKTLLLTVLLLLLTSTTALAEETIVESPNVKIVIDGDIGRYEDVPLIVNNRTMLPLRAVLTYLGVHNDDDHIQWNPEERSVTVVTETQTIWLQVDNKVAMVNGQALTLDVAPMIYVQNNRTYIPARFVSESLGKKVVWDGSTTTVLITDQERHNEILKILESSNNVETSDNYAFDIDYDLYMSSAEGSYDAEMAITLELNTQQDAMHMAMDMHINAVSPETEDQGPQVFTMEMYQMPDYSYVYMPMLFDAWLKSPTESDLDTTMASSTSVDTQAFALEATDIVAAGLVIVEDEDEDYIHLQGNVYMDQLLEDSLGMVGTQTEGLELEIRKYYIDMTLKRETYDFVAMSISMDMTMTDPTTSPVEVIDIVADVDVTYEILQAGYEILVPQEVLDGLIE